MDSHGTFPRRATPLHISLNEPKLLAGANHHLTIMNGVITFVFVMGPGFLWWIGVAFVIQAVLKWANRKDPALLAIYLKYDKQGDVYEPWIKANQKRNLRPEGFGRNVLR